MNWALIGLAGLHLVFALCEMLPWRKPVLLQLVSQKLAESERFSSTQLSLVTTIVHNAGIYNAILGSGLLWAAYRGDDGAELGKVLCIGAAVAGAFGTVTLKSPVTVFQAIAGLVTYFMVR